MHSDDRLGAVKTVVHLRIVCTSDDCLGATKELARFYNSFIVFSFLYEPSLLDSTLLHKRAPSEAGSSVFSLLITPALAYTDSVSLYMSWLGHLDLTQEEDISSDDIIFCYNGSPATETITFYEKEVVIYVLETTVHVGFIKGINFECSNKINVLNAVLKFR